MVLVTAVLRKWRCLARRSLSGVAFSLICGAPPGALACEPVIDSIADTGVRLRANRTELQKCEISQQQYNRLIEQWFQQPDSIDTQWIYLGRIVTYPWLMHEVIELALHDPTWDPAKGTPVSGHENTYLAGLLDRKEIRNVLQAPLPHNETLRLSISVEKVLVGEVSALIPNAGTRNEKVPYDAQVWIHLRNRAGQ